MNITEAGKLTSLTPNTLRYYERIGLIPPVARNKGGTREYTSKDLCWIEFIKPCGQPVSPGNFDRICRLVTARRHLAGSP